MGEDVTIIDSDQGNLHLLPLEERVKVAYNIVTQDNDYSLYHLLLFGEKVEKGPDFPHLLYSIDHLLRNMISFIGGAEMYDELKDEVATKLLLMNKVIRFCEDINDGDNTVNLSGIDLILQDISRKSLDLVLPNDTTLESITVPVEEAVHLMELVNNAEKYKIEGSRIHVEISFDKDSDGRRIRTYKVRNQSDQFTSERFQSWFEGAINGTNTHSGAKLMGNGEGLPYIMRDAINSGGEFKIESMTSQGWFEFYSSSGVVYENNVKSLESESYCEITATFKDNYQQAA